MTQQSASNEAKPAQNNAAQMADDDDNIQQITKFLKLLKQAPNEALMGLIVDSLSVELANKTHRLQTVMDFALKDLPFTDEDFSRLKVSEKLLPLYSQYSNKQQAEAILNKYNLQINSIDVSLPKEKQQRAMQRATERLERSIQVLQLNPTEIPQPKTSTGAAKSSSSQDSKVFKLVTFQSLLHQVDPSKAEQVAQENDKSLGKIASTFFDSLIRNFEPLVASANTAAAPQTVATTTANQQPKISDNPAQQLPEGASEQKTGLKVDDERKDRNKKQIESAIMGGYQNLKSVKLSDFIDEAFLDDLVHDMDDESGGLTKSEKLPLSRLMKITVAKSSILLPQMQSEQEGVSALGNKRRRTESGDLKATHLFMTPILALILNQTEFLLNQDWRRRQVAACNLRSILSHLHKKETQQLEYWLVQQNSENGQLSICQSEESGNMSVQLDDLVRNIIPRLLLFILKDNFSDFAGLKVQTPAREEAMKLLAEIQINSDKQSRHVIQKDIQLLIRILPAIFIAVENDVWHSRLNFFLIIKALVLRSAPESKLRNQILKRFSQLLIMSLPHIEDEPKVAITEILQILLPTYLKSSQPISDTIHKLLENLAFNLSQSDEIEASSIAVFNLVCRVYDLKDDHACLSDLKFKMPLQIFCPFNFHRIEAVRYSYNLLLSKVLSQKDHCFDNNELGQLHTLIMQALAMESSPKLVKILFVNLEKLVQVFSRLDPLQVISATNIQNIDPQQQQPMQQENNQMQETQQVVSESAYASYLRQTLLLDGNLPSWLYDVKPDFQTFLFFKSEAFEDIDQDYFNVVFRPANVSEWDKFYFDKTKNLTRAIALMLGNSRDLDAANLIFSMMCCRTLTYDQNPENGQFEQRTLLNQSMLHMMMSMDRYTRKLAKQVKLGQRNQILANEDGILDLMYLLDLSGQFLGAQEKDVNVFECWQREDLQNSLGDLNNYAMHNSPMILEQLNMIQYYLSSFGTSQSYHYELDFRNAVEYLNDWVLKIPDSTLHGYMYAFYSQHQCLTYFAVEYVGRLKAQAASIILNLASLGIELPEPVSDQKLQLNLFAVDREFVISTASEVVKALLNVVNQERVYFYQKWSAQALVRLLKVAQEHNLTILNRKTLIILTRMLEHEVQDQDPVSLQRLQTVQFFAKELVKCTPDKTIYEAYNGVLGNLMLKPTWSTVQAPSERPYEVNGEDSKEVDGQLQLAMQEEAVAAQTEQQVLMWSHAILGFMRSQTCDGSLKVCSEKLAKRYQVLGFGAIVKLVVKALRILGSSKVLHTATNFPELIDFLFQRLTSKHLNLLMETLVKELEAQSRVAFDSLNRLLETQLKRGESEGTMTFFKYMPAFVLPVIKAIQAQQKIYPVTDANTGVMKILAKLIQLLPLRLSTLEDTENAAAAGGEQLLQEMTKRGLEFLQVFAENRIVTDYELIVPFKKSAGVKLRDYQKEGLNWMAQLGFYNLNCALCDDMGLGKTLQSLCVVLNESEKKKQAQIAEHGAVVDRPCTLVICPVTLTYNWKNEIDKFFEGIKVCIVEGTFQERDYLFSQMHEYDVIIINYEKVKKNMNYLLEKEFFYIVLDEAHKIKNSKSVVTQSVKQLRGQRKLALSGTPLQNRVAELWSLFDFLMPDFLEEETVFNKTYNKYLTGNIKKMSENLEETEQFINALKSLKRRIAPFILRRTKEQVLKELPPKVIQDYPCSMTPFQAAVHSEVEKRFPFASSVQQKKEATTEQDKKESKKTLRNLILHRKACNHPELLRKELPDLFTNAKGAVKQAHAASVPKVLDYTTSGKLLGLVEVLQQTEIIANSEGAEETKAGSTNVETSLANYAATAQQSHDAEGGQPVAVNTPHRALIFCQMSSCLEMVCKQVLDRFGVKYQKLLGSVNARERIQIVNQFNHDQSVRVLILTTAVGGLGLTLTGADVVIFMEHDWNPMNDLQAMDRAHRIGQTRTVNVYRMIMRGTIEDKIMNLQRFKENLAKSLIQARGGDISTTDVANLELTDLLKSFEEHSGYKQGQNPQASTVQKDEKSAKGAKMVKQLVSGGLPVDTDLGKDSMLGGQAGDTELANIEQIWQALSDVEDQ